MSVELVTGYYGVDSGGKPKRHVSSAEDGARQAGTVGLGCYALSTGSKLSATMEDANTLVVADGDVMMNGRHVSLPDATSFTIPTGVQGQKVSNIAVLRYQKAADSVESVTPLVLTGEPSTGTPSDPEYNEGSILDGDSPVDFPLYRVVINGVNVGDPVPLFDVLLPMADLWDSVSQVKSTADSAKSTANAVANKMANLSSFGIISDVISTNPQYNFTIPAASILSALRMQSVVPSAKLVVYVCNGDLNAARNLSLRTVAVNPTTWDVTVFLGEPANYIFRYNACVFLQ
jgi:hypothetical protein